MRINDLPLFTLRRVVHWRVQPRPIVGRLVSLTDEKQQGGEDLTGQERLTWNVLVSWASQLITIVLGFVLPRMIDQQLSQVSLGIWDFAWAIVSYLTIVDFGVGSNAARYVAQFRIEQLPARLNEVVSSAHFVQVLVSVAVVLLTLAAFFILGRWLPAGMSTHVDDARYLVLLLGLGFAIQMYFDAYRGVLTGCHRWDVHSAINSMQNILAAVGMIAVLLNGHGLISLAMAYVAASTMAEITRFLAARHFCPEARPRIRLVNLRDLEKVAVFGFKNVLVMAGPLIVQQTMNMLITMRLGPAMLAVFVRPTAIIRHLETFIFKFAFVLLPTASSLQQQGRHEDLRKFAIETSRVGWALAVPGGVFLLVMGPQLIELWMGPGYVVRELIMILAIGGTLSAANRPAYRILFGLDNHGTAAAASMVIYGGVLVAGLVAMLWFDGGLVTAAFIFVIGDVLFGLVIVPHQLAKSLGMTWIGYIWAVSHRVLLIGGFSYLVLLFVHFSLRESLAINVLLGAALHGALVGVMYWRLVLSDGLKASVRKLIWRR